MPFSEKRFFILSIFPAIILSIILIRLFYLQIIRGSFYHDRSQSNFIQERPINHSRGMIFDQSGTVLVDNRPAHDLYVTFAMLPDSQKTLKQIATFMGKSHTEIKQLQKQLGQALKSKNPTSLNLGIANSSKACADIDNFLEVESILGIQIQYLENQREECQIKIIPAQLPSKAKGFKDLQKLLNLSDEDFEPYVRAAEKKFEGLGQFKPILFMSDISFEAYARIETAVSLGLLPGIAIFDSIRRRYIYNNFASHALGFLNEISPKELAKNDEFRPGQRIGRKGIEKVYEKKLRGIDGVERYVVDAKGRRFNESWEKTLLGDERIIAPKPGQGIVLAIDYELQTAAENAFRGQAGSVVALEVGTGFVLALASFPNYNPNEIISRNNKKILTTLNQNPLKPWVNKATQENYAPGSTFKAVTAVAGFERNLLTPRTHHNCTGTFYLGRASWRCFKREGHGTLHVVDALKTSCDSFFYTLGHALGSENLASIAKLLGFGKKTGIDLDLEVAGIIPDRAYYLKRLGYDAPGFVINSSIGQGDVTVTPIQLAVAYDAILNGGTIYKPQLVREIVNVHSEPIEKIKPTIVAHLKENEEDLKLVKEGLAYVMKPGGTVHSLLWRPDLPQLSKWLRESGVVIGGKTGTAQVVKLSKSIKHLDPAKVAYQQRDHAWFVGFAPVEKPEIVVVAMTEHGGFGGTTSAPVVAEMVKIWYEKVRGKGRYAHLEKELVQ